MDSGGASFRYEDCALPIRPDIPAAHRRAWSRLASAGTWWRGEQRVAIAGEVRAADGCRFCSERRGALSPSAVDGVHDSTPRSRCLPDAAVDAVHRITTDAGRLTQTFVSSLADQGISDAAYVELVGVAVTVLSIDRLHRGLGVALEALPEPEAGEPSLYRPLGAKASAAFVPMVSGRDAKGAEADLYDGLPTAPNVLSALSLVPDEVRQLDELSAAHYLPRREMMRFDTRLRAISRAQIELLAARVSAMNECFYWTSSHAMMLRASVEAGGGSADLRALTGGVGPAESRVPNGDVLIAFAEAVVGGREEVIEGSRRELVESVGPEACVDACGVIGNFERMVRIADSTGIPLDAPVAALTIDIREELGIDGFRSARNTPALGLVGRMLGPAGRAVALAGIRAAAAFGRKDDGKPSSH